MTASRGAGALVGTSDVRTRVLRRRVRLVVAATITYNVVEAAVAVSAAAIAWQFAAADHVARERVALRVVAFSFFALAAYVTVDAARALAGAVEPGHSPVGVALAAASLVVMPGLSWWERRTGRELGSASVVADSAQTLLCSYLSGVLLLGLLANSVLGWSWADPVAALVIAAVAVTEGRRAWRGDACCSSPGALLDDDDGALDRCCPP